MQPIRFLSEAWSYVAGLGRSAIEGWDRFFFRPADPTPLGLIRVAVGALAFWSIWIYGYDLSTYLGESGYCPSGVVREFLEDLAPAAWSFWFLIPDGLLWPAWGACLVVLGLFTLGVGSPVTAVLSWAIVVSTARRAPFSLYGFDQILSTWLLYLAATGASGRAVSLDRYFRRWRENRRELATRRKEGGWVPSSGVPVPSVSANIALRLIQCHLVVIYGMAALAKFQGRAWWDGTAIWGTLAAGEFRRFNLTWLAAYPYLLNFLTHAALAIELLYPVLIWVPRLRPMLIALMIGLHAGIDLTLGLTEFGLVMVAGNLAFASGPWLRSFASGRAQPAGRVLYDGACPMCRSSMALIKAGDPDRVIEPVDLTGVDVTKVHPGLTKEACMKSMHLVRADGRVEAGYDAVMRILSWTPLFWLPSTIRFVPGVAWIGRRAYNRIAAARPRDLICTDEVCGLHPAPRGDRGKSELSRSGRA